MLALVLCLVLGVMMLNLVMLVGLCPTSDDHNDAAAAAADDDDVDNHHHHDIEWVAATFDPSRESWSWLSIAPPLSQYFEENNQKNYLNKSRQTELKHK